VVAQQSRESDALVDRLRGRRDDRDITLFTHKPSAISAIARASLAVIRNLSLQDF